MKQIIFIPLAFIGAMPIANPSSDNRKAPGISDSFSETTDKNKALDISTQDEQGI